MVPQRMLRVRANGETDKTFFYGKRQIPVYISSKSTITIGEWLRIVLVFIGNRKLLTSLRIGRRGEIMVMWYLLLFVVNATLSNIT